MGPVLFFLIAAVVLSAWLAGHDGGRRRSDDARWARRRDLGPLLVRTPTAGRLTVGVSCHRLVAAESRHSLLVVGPTQSHKTTGLAIPALLEWRGPVLAASVKGDLLAHTVAWRRRHGTVWVYDPTATTVPDTARWSPLSAVTSWAAARRVADELVQATRSSATAPLADGDFWYATAAKLLAPLLLAAAGSGRTMADVMRWVEEHETDEVARALDAAGQAEALRALWATAGRDDRQRSAVYTTAETVVEVFADPAVAAATVSGPGAPGRPGRPGTPDAVGAVDPRRLLEGDHTLYLCAPAHEQRRLRPLFAGLVARVIEAAYDRAAAAGRPLDPPLLVVLDEAANVAPLADLDTLASTAAGHGIQLVTVWQDMAQITARYGPRAGTVVNNHRAKLFLSGIADPDTLDHASALIGETALPQRSTTVDRGRSGAHSTTTTPVFRRLAPADALRRMPPGTGVLVCGHLPPVRLALRPWYADRVLRARAQEDPDPTAP